MSDHPRNHHEFTIDEAVEFQIAHLQASRAGSSLRRRHLWKSSILFVLGVIGGIYFSARARIPIDAGQVILIAGGAAVLCPLAYFAFARLYDRRLRRHVRRTLVEHFGGEGPHPCTIEAPKGCGSG